MRLIAAGLVLAFGCIFWTFLSPPIVLSCTRCAMRNVLNTHINELSKDTENQKTYQLGNPNETAVVRHETSHPTTQPYPALTAHSQTADLLEALEIITVKFRRWLPNNRSWGLKESMPPEVEDKDAKAISAACEKIRFTSLLIGFRYANNPDAGDQYNLTERVLSNPHKQVYRSVFNGPEVAELAANECLLFFVRLCCWILRANLTIPVVFFIPILQYSVQDQYYSNYVAYTRCSSRYADTNGPCSINCSYERGT